MKNCDGPRSRQFLREFNHKSLNNTVEGVQHIGENREGKSCIDYYVVERSSLGQAGVLNVDRTEMCTDHFLIWVELVLGRKFGVTKSDKVMWKWKLGCLGEDDVRAG
eukprot:TRINITY_DN4462_c1_g1_i1.p1 TRINITY_DN4462_c1_g1~~TRINITY_DN4462_c1_g1_i1.p1  ORF type:complete len:107 (-),score=4.79 TRINITY_DN4462_c1_g1_i1:654-974(-)